MVRALAVASLLGAINCAPAPALLEHVQSPVLNGADDRLEAFQTPAETRAPLLAASAALVWTHHLVESAPGEVTLRAPTARAALDLCADEPFADEPAAAFCSAVLVDDDLVATAGHCLGADPAARACADLRVVFGYALASASEPVAIGADAVFACRRIVARAGDLAVLQLDRPVAAPLAPRPVAAAGARAGDAVVVASHGAGLPLKVELAAAVTEVAPESGDLTVAMDTFGGSSGGGLYDRDLSLVALVGGGAIDWEEVGGCSRAAHSDAPRERGIDATTLPELVCGAGWPSRRLCGAPPACGDGICGAGERAACPRDCPPPRCGDSLCEPAERGACAADCARYASVPASWLDDPAEDGAALARPSATPPTAATGCSIAPSSSGHRALLLAAALVAASAVARRRR